MKPILLIPAYNPEKKLVPILKQIPTDAFTHILIVNDGSRNESVSTFNQLSSINNVTILNHDKNQGKGAALKTGFSYILDNFEDCSGVVTADADGQHTAQDILEILNTFTEHSNRLIIGSRAFDQDVPLRSLIGNKATRLLMRLFFKIDLSDTQSGLRAIPRALVPNLLAIRFNRYEFEIEMLMIAKKNNFQFKEIMIATIYENNNIASSFNPVVDSAKIYFVLFRYVLASLATAAVDYAVFFVTYSMYPKIFVCTYLARMVALIFNFILLRKFVFHSKGRLTLIILKYLTLVGVSGFISSLMIQYFNTQLHLSIVLSKGAAELLLYFAIFVLQKEIVFKKGKQ